MKTLPPLSEEPTPCVLTHTRNKFFGDKKISDEAIKATLAYSYETRQRENPIQSTAPAFDIARHQRDPQIYLFSESTKNKFKEFISETKDPSEAFEEKLQEVSQKIIEIISEEQFKHKELEKIVKENKELEFRISPNLLETTWYARRIGLDNKNVENLFNFMLSIEKPMKWKERKFQMSRNQPEKNELTFNHFLDVARTTMGFIDSILFRWEELSEKEQELYRPLLNKENVLISIISALLHDYQEDELLSEKQIITKLNEFGFTDKSMQQKILHNIQELNINEYKDENDKKDYGKYLKNILKDPILTVIKFSDILSNFRSPIKIKKDSFEDGEFKKTGKGPKYQKYISFLGLMVKYDIAKLIPKRFIDEIKTNNQDLSGFSKLPIWKKMEKVIPLHTHSPNSSAA